MRSALHGSLVEISKVGVLILGKSGIGKSTFAFYLRDRNHTLVADDLVLLYRSNHKIFGFGARKARQSWQKYRNLGDASAKNYKNLTQIQVVCQLYKEKTYLQYFCEPPTIISHYLLGNLIPKILLPRQSLLKQAKIIEVFIKKLTNKD